MTFTKLILALACLMSGTLVAQEAKVAELLSKDLTNLPGKEGLMLIVEYPPGSSDPIHRHNAHGFIYVLEGSIVMQVKGGLFGSGEFTAAGLIQSSFSALSSRRGNHRYSIR